jgi:hypothetical protein
VEVVRKLVEQLLRLIWDLVLSSSGMYLRLYAHSVARTGLKIQLRQNWKKSLMMRARSVILWRLQRYLRSSVIQRYRPLTSTLCFLTPSSVLITQSLIPSPQLTQQTQVTQQTQATQGTLHLEEGENYGRL